MLILLISVISACSQNADKSNESNKVEEIDEEISRIIESNKDFVCVEYENFEEYYLNGELIRRSFLSEFENESYAIYNLYYDSNGSLMLAEVAHYRSFLYSIYFNEDTPIYVYWDKFSNLNGNIEHVKSLIKENSDYVLILNDVEVILERAY